MDSLRFFHLPLLISLFCSLSEAYFHPDFQPLMAFKTGSDLFGKLSWNDTCNLCTWQGVFCFKDHVSRLVLEDLNLTGSFQPLTALRKLRVLSLKRNLLSGSVPDLSNLTTLKLLFLTGNSFSGAFPASITDLIRLRRLDLARNKLSGEIPPTINRLTHLLTLRLEENHFTGSIPILHFPNLRDLNVSGNLLNGIIPETLATFPKTAFTRNHLLCGTPLSDCTSIKNDSNRPWFDPPVSDAKPTENASSSVIASSPSLKSTAGKSSATSPYRHHRRAMRHFAIALIAVGDFLILALLCGFLYCCFCKNSKMDKRSQLLEGEKVVFSSSPYRPSGYPERETLVFCDGTKEFELDDLLKASAEMLGKGTLGTAYKAVLENGNIVAVKRLKDIQAVGRSDFEQRMKILGQLRHPNIVGLRGYYYSTDEKLLVYQYMPNGSLFSLLHGNRGPGRTPLDWTTRVKIAAGAARGIAFIHDTYGGSKLCHGNLKSTNILIDKAGNGRVADVGLSVFTAATGVRRFSGYRAPELTDGRKISQKADVFAFGVILMEILTGKCPSTSEGDGGKVDLPRWVQSMVREEWTVEVFDLELMRYKDIEEETVGMLKLALGCVALVPEQRPGMGEVVRMIEEMCCRQSSPSHDSLDSLSDSDVAAMEEGHQA